MTGHGKQQFRHKGNFAPEPGAAAYTIWHIKMVPTFRACRMVLFFLAQGWWGGAMFSAKAQGLPAISPTVTVEMGDAGGKIFGRVPDTGRTRHYFIAAEPEMWDYVPEGQDIVCGKPLPPP